MPRKIDFLMLLSIVLTLFVFVACGSDDSADVDGDESSEPTAGDSFLASDDENYMLPHLFKQGNDLVMLVRGNNGVYSQNLTTKQAPAQINLSGSAVPAYGVGQYTVNSNYFVWNTNSPKAFRHQWATHVTQEAQTGSLSPGMCIITNKFGSEALAAVQPGGYLYLLTLNKFTDAGELGNRITLIDPAANTNAVSVQSFACAGNMAFVATSDGRLFELNMDDNTPTLLGPIVTGGYFELLQYSAPYLVWIDKAGDIKMYNTETKAAPVVVVNVDPVALSVARVMDLRIFGSIVIWSDDSDRNYNIWAADLAKFAGDPNTSYIQVTKEPNDQRYPYLYEGIVYWQDNRSSTADAEKWEIWKGNLPAL